MIRRTLIVGAMLALLLQAIVGVETLSSGAVNLPQVNVPPVSVPPVNVPPVTVPAVSVPSLPTPAGNTPPVSTPPVSTPPVSTPSVSTPSVSTPAGSTPSVRAPSLGSTGAPAGSLPSATGAGSSGAGAGTTLSAGSGSSVGGAAPSSATGARGRGTHGGGARSGAGGHRAASADAQLRSLVARLSGCLSALAPQSQRLLVLRAGIGGAPITSAAVSQILHISIQQEANAERTALTALQSAAHDHGCGSSGGVAVLSTAPEGLVLLTGPAGQGSFARSAVASGLARVAAFHENRASDVHRAGPSSVPFQNAAIEQLLASSSSAAILTIAAIMLLVALALLAATGRRFAAQQRLAIAGTGGQGEIAAAGPPAALAPTALAPMAPAASAAQPETHVEQGRESDTTALEPSALLAPGLPRRAPDAPAPPPESPTPTPAPAAQRSSESLATADGRGNWLRQHGSEVALGLTAVAGALQWFARSRGHGRGRRRR